MNLCWFQALPLTHTQTFPHSCFIYKEMTISCLFLVLNPFVLSTGAKRAKKVNTSHHEEGTMVGNVSTR